MTAQRDIARIQDCHDYADALVWASLQTFNAGIRVTTATGGLVDIRRDDATIFNNQVIGTIQFRSDVLGQRGAELTVKAEGTWASGDTPGRIVFATTPDNSSMPVDVVAIKSTGNVQLLADDQLLQFGAAQDYSIQWDGDDAVHTIVAGQFRFVGGNIELEDTDSDGPLGVIYKGADRFIHNFHHADGGGAVPDGLNTFIGVNAGNLTLGNTATQTYHSSTNTGIGSAALNALTTGYRNMGIGENALTLCNSGYSNVAVGTSTLRGCTTGFQNMGVGQNALLALVNGNNNVGIGQSGLREITQGVGNLGIGANAGRYIADGSTPNQTTNNSVYLGTNTKASADGADNEIVIGHNAIGKGANTMVLGGSTVTTVFLPNDDQKLAFGAAGTTDYTIEWDGDDAVHTITAGDFVFTGGNFEIDVTTASVGQLIQDGSRIFHTYEPTDQAATYRNVFIGKNSGNFTLNNTTLPYHGTGNIGIGDSTLDALTTGFYNFGLGTLSLSAVTSGLGNVGIGHQTGENITTSSYNALIGRSAGINIVGGSGRNIGIGQNALGGLTSGAYNVAVGDLAGRYIANGSSPNQTPDNSVYIGKDTKASADGADNEIVIGYNAIGKGANTMVLGGSTVTTVFLPNDNQQLAFGAAGTTDYTIEWDGDDAVHTVTAGQFRFVGGNIELEDTISPGNLGVIYKGADRFIHNFHHHSGNTQIPDGNNTFIGVNAGNLTMGSTATQAVQGSENVGIGYRVLDALTTGYRNIGVGADTLGACTGGTYNTGIGSNSLLTLTTGGQNVAIGYGTLLSCTDHYNVAIGYGSLLAITSGVGNIGIGHSAGWYIANGSTPNQTPDNSLYLGRDTKASTDGEDNEIVIGYNAIGKGANTMVLGGSAITTVFLPNDNQQLAFGAAGTTDYTIEWDGDDAVHTITAGQFVFTGGNIELEDTTDANAGVIMKGADRFIHNFHHPSGDTQVPDGDNIFIGINAGNLTLGSGATSVSHGSANVGIGTNTLGALTDGFANMGIGPYTLSSCTTGAANVGVGTFCLRTLTGANNNVGIGTFTLDLTNGYGNVALGYAALYPITSGSYNVGVGLDAGRYIANGSTPNETSDNSVYIGRATKASADGADNEIVIGYQAIGKGANTAVIGGSTLTKVFMPTLALLERSVDPTEPEEGESVIWMSDGTEKGDDGDILIASKAGGITKWGTLFDHSGGAGW